MLLARRDWLIRDSERPRTEDSSKVRYSMYSSGLLLDVVKTLVSVGYQTALR